jgi:hypothetical protein
MRTIKVRNATILAKLGTREIDFEIRTSKDSAQGFSLLVDGVKWLDVDLSKISNEILMDGQNFDNKEPLFKIKDIKSNGCL